MRDIVDEPPIHLIWPYSSSASSPKDSVTSSSVLTVFEVDGSNDCWCPLDVSESNAVGTAGAILSADTLPGGATEDIGVPSAEGPSCSSTGAI